MNNLGTLLYATGDLRGATRLFREALGASREVLGDRHPDTLISITALGLLLLAKGYIANAAPQLRDALEVQREPLGARSCLLHRKRFMP